VSGWVRAWAALALPWALAGCTFDPLPAGAFGDAGAGLSDAAEAPDAGPPADTGLPLTDAGSVDGGAPDGAPADAEPADVGPTSTCGDGVVAAGEACDDRGLDPGDGCSPTCTVEDGWACTGDAPSVCVALPTLAAADVMVDEGDEATVVVTLSGPAPLPVTFRWSTADDTAQAPGDYTPKSGVLVTLPAGEERVGLAISTAADGVPEGTESLTVHLMGITNATPGAVTARVTLIDDTVLIDRGLVARYYLDDAGPNDPAPMSVADAAPSPLNLPLVYNSGEPRFVAEPTGRGLRWSAASGGGRATASASGKIRSRLDGSTRATLEVVATVLDDSNASRILYVGQDQGYGDLSMLIAGSSLYLGYNGRIQSWSIPTAARQQRAVFTLVFDSTRDRSDRLHAYVNGESLRNPVYVPVDGDTTLAIPGGRDLVIGNRPQGGWSPEGVISYAALYDEGLSSAEVQHNTQLLLQRDDPR
jgi:cysteine-rich repeat protein